jgi:hypothetical protein
METILVVPAFLRVAAQDPLALRVGAWIFVAMHILWTSVATSAAFADFA